jgi:transposase
MSGRLTCEQRWRIVHMSLDGHSDRSIAKKLKTTNGTVRKWLSRYHLSGNVCAIPGKGRPLALNDQACSKALELLLDHECGGLRFVTQALKL